MKKKIVISIVIILAIILLIVSATTIRKATIIYKYSEKLTEYQETKNFYAKFKTDDFVEEMWRKEDIGIIQIKKDNITRTMCIKPDETRIYIEDGNSKTASVTKTENHEEAFLPVIEQGTLYAENFWDAWIIALGAKITTEEINEKECYKVYMQEDFQIYINKENLLNVKEINGNTTRELIEYEINTLKEEDVEFPSLEGYEVSQYR